MRSAQSPGRRAQRRLALCAPRRRRPLRPARALAPACPQPPSRRGRPRCYGSSPPSPPAFSSPPTARARSAFWPLPPAPASRCLRSDAVAHAPARQSPPAPVAGPPARAARSVAATAPALLLAQPSPSPHQARQHLRALLLIDQVFPEPYTPGGLPVPWQPAWQLSGHPQPAHLLRDRLRQPLAGAAPDRLRVRLGAARPQLVGAREVLPFAQ